MSTGPEAESMDTTSDGQVLSMYKKHVDQTEHELSGEAYKYTAGNGITITEDKEAMLRALNNIIRLVNVVLRDRQHAISKLEVDIEAQRGQRPRQQRSMTSDSDSQPDAKRSRSSSSSPRSPLSCPWRVASMLKTKALQTHRSASLACTRWTLWLPQ